MTETFTPLLETFEGYLQDEFLAGLGNPVDGETQFFHQALEYSLLGGGKRFRPLLALSFAQDFGIGPKPCLPWAVAVELIHTYSLLHDDLPCMDNDDFRRGKPSSHKVFGESLALLAGDALLTEAFGFIADKYKAEEKLAVELVRVLSRAAGAQGMIRGQVLDLRVKKTPLTKEDLILLHKLKTGALIKATLEGAALAGGVSSRVAADLGQFGELLGLAFQMKDDQLDADQEEPVSFLRFCSLPDLQMEIDRVHDQARAVGADLKLSQQHLLIQLLNYNRERKK